jgi:hypothetical protein
VLIVKGFHFVGMATTGLRSRCADTHGRRLGYDLVRTLQDDHAIVTVGRDQYALRAATEGLERQVISG